MNEEKKARGKAEGTVLKQQVIGCIDRQLHRLPSPRERLWLLQYLIKQIQDEVLLEDANRLAKIPFPTVNGVPRQIPMGDWGE